MLDGGDRDVAQAYPLPAVYLGVEAGKGVAAYLGVVDEEDITTVNYNFTTNPAATVFRSNELKDTLAPFMATFSSRGPSTITPDILKSPAAIKSALMSTGQRMKQKGHTEEKLRELPEVVRIESRQSCENLYNETSKIIIILKL
ncbi:hypothetical protein LguiA_034897 [Lonicera macranthoides]